MRIFDGHNDFLQRMVAAGPDGAALWLNGNGTGHIDLPRLRQGGMAGGFFAIWIPSENSPEIWASRQSRQENPPYQIEVDAEIPAETALPHAFAQAAALRAMERTGTLDIVTSAQGIVDSMDADRIAAIMHMEGAEAITDFDSLCLWHQMGLRSLGPVWSRPTRFAQGVPFAFPASPDIGGGLTARGRDLIKWCNELRIMVDLAHLNEAGFRDIAALSTAPLVSTHTAAHHIAPSSRNLTDDQLRMIAESGGLVGLNFATGFLRPDGRRQPFAGFDLFLRHLDHLLMFLGEDGVALGSDFDGALMADALSDAADLPKLIAAMRHHGYGEALIEKIAWRNWITLLRQTWGH